MGKAEIISAMARQTGFTKAACEKTINSFIKNVSNTLQAGNKMKLSGFGSFRVIAFARIKGRNPKTGEEVTIPPFKTVKFKASKEFKKNLTDKLT